MDNEININNQTVKKKTTNTRQAKKKKRTSYQTYTGHTLTVKEAKFINNYVETGNGRKSVELAGYNVSPNSRAQKAQELLNKIYITEEINHRLDEHKNKTIADKDEIMQYFTDVMRGKIKDQFGLDPSLQERTRAGQELAKRTIDIEQRLKEKNPNSDMTVTLIMRDNKE